MYYYSLLSAVTGKAVQYVESTRCRMLDAMLAVWDYSSTLVETDFVRISCATTIVLL